MNAALPERAQRVLELVQQGRKITEIAKELEITRNAVYQQIGKLRRDGYLPERESGGEAAQGSFASVADAVSQFRASLHEQKRQLDARSQALRLELDRLAEESSKVDALLVKLRDEEAAGVTPGSPTPVAAEQDIGRR